MDFETRLTNLENLVHAFIKSQSKSDDYTKYDIEGCRAKETNLSEQVEAITPYMDSQRAYIGDTSVMFENIKNGLITVYCETDSGLVIPTKSEKSGDRLTVSFDTLEEVATVTISIM